MSKSHQGTYLDFNGKFGTGQAVVDKNYPNNPENAGGIQNQAGVDMAENEGQKESKMKRLWKEWTTMKKVGIIVGVLIVITIIILIPLLVMMSRPSYVITIISDGRTNVPNSDQQLNLYKATITRKKIGEKTDKTIGIATITNPKNGRRAQAIDDSYDENLKALVMTFDVPGGTVIAKGTEDFQLLLYPDQLLSSYFENQDQKRLLFESEINTALRNLQEISNFDNENVLSSIENIMVDSFSKVYGKITGTDQSNIQVKKQEVVDIVVGQDGTYTEVENYKSPRQLQEVSSTILEDSLKILFDEIAQTTLKKAIEEVQQTIAELVNDNTTPQNAQFKQLLKGTNFDSNIDVNEESNSSPSNRLLQELLSKSKDKKNNQKKEEDGKQGQNKKQSKGKTRPFNQRRKCGGKRKTISKQAADGLTECTGKGKNRTCDKKYLNKTSCVYKDKKAKKEVQKSKQQGKQVKESKDIASKNEKKEEKQPTQLLKKGSPQQKSKYRFRFSGRKKDQSQNCSPKKEKSKTSPADTPVKPNTPPTKVDTSPAAVTPKKPSTTPEKTNTSPSPPTPTVAPRVTPTVTPITPPSAPTVKTDSTPSSPPSPIIAPTASTSNPNPPPSTEPKKYPPS